MSITEEIRSILYTDSITVKDALRVIEILKKNKNLIIDNEEMHIYEDQLRGLVLRTITQLSKIASSTEDIEFTRWFA